MMMLLLSALLCQDEFTITKESLEALVKEVRPLVEKATGRTFKSDPKVELSTPKRVAELLSTELLPQMRVLFPKASDEDHRRTASKMAEGYSRYLLGKYAATDNSVHVVPDNFKILAEMYKKPRINSAEYLRVVGIHELVHALDEQEFRVVTRIAERKSTDEIVIWNAVMEGHAQHVTRRILVEEKREELFKEFEAQMMAVPPGLSDVEKAAVEAMSIYTKFAYIDGCAFFDGLARTGRKTYVEDVFSKPPADKEIVLNPPSYYDPKAKRAARDLSALFDRLEKDWKDWNGTRSKIGAMELRAAMGPFADKKQMDALLDRLIGAPMVVLQPKSGGEKMIALISCEMDADESAARMLDLFVAVLKAKDEKMKDGAVRIVKAEYGELKTKSGAKNVIARKRMSAGDEEAPMTSALVLSGRFLVELTYVNEEVTDENLSAVIDVIVEELKK